jgi:hypothetical protein
VSECVFTGPLPRTGHGADHIENTSSVVRMRVYGPFPSTGYGSDHIENTFSNTFSIVACPYFGRCLEMGLRVTILIPNFRRCGLIVRIGNPIVMFYNLRKEEIS